MNVTFEQLKKALPVLSDRDQEAAASLLDQWQERGLTVKQLSFAAALAKRAEGKAPLASAGLDRVRALFEAAYKAGLKFPKVWIAPHLTLKPAGPRSAHPGTIQVMGDGFDEWFGRIELDGSLTAGRDMPADAPRILREWAADPAKAASAFGHLTGHCAFCAKELTDPRSVAVGYGPVCADNYGLAWGVKKAAPVVVEL